MSLLSDYTPKMKDGEIANRPIWGVERTGATLADGVHEPADEVVTESPGTYRCYFAGNPTVAVDLYLDTTPRRYALVKVTDTSDVALADGVVTFLYKR